MGPSVGHRFCRLGRTGSLENLLNTAELSQCVDFVSLERTNQLGLLGLYKKPLSQNLCICPMKKDASLESSMSLLTGGNRTFKKSEEEKSLTVLMVFEEDIFFDAPSTALEVADSGEVDPGRCFC